jgi:hypothetical protein
MHVLLLNLGFVKKPDGSYYNNELSLVVYIENDKQVKVVTVSGFALATIEELEDAIVSGAFGAY